MGREFREFAAEFDRKIRSQIAKESDLTDTTTAVRWLLRGTELCFYPEAWLAYLERIEPDAGRPQRYYFVVQTRETRRRPRLVPMANEAGSVDRANRECGLVLPERGGAELGAAVIDYLNFYYAFTPQYDALLASIDEGPTHFGVPLSVDDIRFDPATPNSASHGGPCSDACLAQGAVWHYLDSETKERFAAIRLRMRKAPYPRVTGRIVIQFRRGLFATDFRLPASTNVPALGNPELLYESTTLRGPVIYPQAAMHLHGYLGLGDLGRAFKATVTQIAALISSTSIAAIAGIVTLLLSLVWLLTWAFPLVEMTGWQGTRPFFYLIGLPLGFDSWAHSLRAISLFAIAAFLAGIVYTTHMDKIFNLLFWLCPRIWRMRLTETLVKRVNKRDRELIAQDTFRKRAWWALRRLGYWTAYIILAFASMQIALNTLYGEQHASAARIVLTLVQQAAINVPLILYVLVRLPGLIENLDPVADGILNAQLLFCFHATMVLIVIKGVYRVWAFTVDASPHAFYRRLPVTNRHSAGDIDVV